MRFKFAFVCLLFSVTLWAQEPRPTGYVVDQAQALRSRHYHLIQQAATSLNKQTGIDFAVLTLASLDDEPIEKKAVTVFETWALGDKDADTGILMLIAPLEKQIRIEVGYGLEGILPDARIGRVIDQAIIPYFKQQQISEGIFNGYQAVLNILAEHYSFQVQASVPSVSRSQVSEPQALLFLPVLLLIACLLPFRWGRRLLSYLFIALLFSSSRTHSRMPYGSFGNGGFGGFGGGLSGGAGASRSW